MPKIAAGATNKNISLAPNGTGKVVVGTGAADATVQSDGDHNLILQTGNSTTGKIEIADGANGNIDLTPNGTGEVDIPKVDIDGGAVDGITLGTNSAVTEAQIDNINIDGNEITSTDTNGNIDLTPNGTGEVNISKVDIDGGAIDGTNVTVGSGKTLDVSAGTLTTSTTQKQAIVDGAEIEGTDILSTGESGSTKFLRENGTSPASWEEVGSASLPSQTGNADKLLTTNGTAASWTNAPINLVKLAFAGQSSAPGSPSAGTLYYSSTTNMLFFWNGTAFIPAGDLASGGIITGYTSGSDYYRVHTFLQSATFIASVTLSADVLIVGGGGGGGSGAGGTGDGAGGGGGGGVIYGTGRVMNAGSYTVTIGGGGAVTGGDTTVAGLWNGSSGTLTATATGGGSGGNDGVNGGNGGNGGGGGGYGNPMTGGSGTQANQLSGTSELTKAGPYDGGDNNTGAPYMGGGGGGAGGDGTAGSTSGTSVAGGIPMQNAYRTGTNVDYAEGGKGVWTYVGSAGADNTGNGGDGGITTGLIGGSGIVVIRYAI